MCTSELPLLSSILSSYNSRSCRPFAADHLSSTGYCTSVHPVHPQLDQLHQYSRRHCQSQPPSTDAFASFAVASTSVGADLPQPPQTTLTQHVKIAMEDFGKAGGDLVLVRHEEVRQLGCLALASRKLVC